MPNLGAPELIIIALVILLLFGATRLPNGRHVIDVDAQTQMHTEE